MNRFKPLDGHPEPGCVQTAPGRFSFTVWAPFAQAMDLEFVHPRRRRVPMERAGGGYWRVEAGGVSPGDLYLFVLDSSLARPDPASHHQPRDVHGPSAVTGHDAFGWKCAGFTPPGLGDLILYELHVGAFTPEGTFAAAISRLDGLAELGITAVEVMPVAQFPGERNWGYDGVQPYAVQHSYGGPGGFKGFIDACHERGLAVILDVVYNHLGPEGNYLRDFGPYFTDRCQTPWGEAVNLDGPYSDHVRAYFLHNLLHWIRRYRVDGFRLDATHAYHDERPDPFLRAIGDLASAFRTQAGAAPLILAESDLNDPRISMPRPRGGMGLSGQFGEDFHHCVHAMLTGERQGYYCDFGRPEQLAKALRKGFAFTGEYSAFRERSHGEDPSRLPPEAIAGFVQNHDQVGNRAHGERLSSLAGFEACKAAAGLLLLSPYTPLLFMGEEHFEDNPFLYFISHLDEGLAQAVRQGRKREFADFHDGRPDPPDPASPETFARSKLDWTKRGRGRHRLMLELYAELIRLRKQFLRPAAEKGVRPKVSSHDGGLLLVLRYPHAGGSAMLFNLSPDEREADFKRMKIAGAKVLDSSGEEWGGAGPLLPGLAGGRAGMAPWSFAVYASGEAHP
ncbi:MAG: malto-oligosyltrehalose trehalohydrolase [Thermodesulfobacteriota bacterium]